MSRVSVDLNNQIVALREQGRDAEADAIYDWALELSSQLFGDANPTTTFFRDQYAYHLRATDREEEAALLLGE